jgi:hypothetical protein
MRADAPAFAVFTAAAVLTVALTPGRENRLNHVIMVVGRLKPRVSVEKAQAEMDAISRRVAKQYPEVKDWGIGLVTFYRTFVSDQLQTALLVLLGGGAADRDRAASVRGAGLSGIAGGPDGGAA